MKSCCACCGRVFAPINRRRRDATLCRTQVMHKAPVKEAKQVEHIVSERQVIGEAAHPLCVRLRSAYQDAASLYLLQDWIPGAPAHGPRCHPVPLPHINWT